MYYILALIIKRLVGYVLHQVSRIVMKYYWVVIKSGLECSYRNSSL